jgi:hypothetical protein
VSTVKKDLRLSGTCETCGARTSRKSSTRCRKCANAAARVYETREAAAEARRESKRRYQRKQWARYTQTCAQAEIRRAPAWQAHLRELNEIDQTPSPLNAELVKTEKNPYRRWWLKRFTLDEIHQMARGL